MLKTWQRVCAVPIKSLTLELRAVNFLDTWEHAGKGPVYYDWMVRDYFSELVKCVGRYCEIPGTEDRCYYGDAWLNKARIAYTWAVEACNAEYAELPLTATEEWQKIFGGQFEYRA
jgi:hypothetical protein